MAPRRRKPAPLPGKDDILRFVREHPERADARHIARAFGLRGRDREALEAVLDELRRDGRMRAEARRPGPRRDLPSVTVVEITGVDADGDLLGRPVAWRRAEPPPRIYVAPEWRGGAALGVGERMLARLSRFPDGTYEARIIRRIHRAPNRILGIYQRARGGGGRLVPTARRERDEPLVEARDSGGARPGELVVAEIIESDRLGPRRARVVERLGDAEGPQAISRIAIHSHDIPTEFPAPALARAAAARPVPLGRRVDLRDLPLVTIDGEDARDFDDAVWAEPDGNGGWHLVVAIADVAHYVRPGDALDSAAYERGNSVYFPDLVVPMLPEALSNGLCSLRPGEDRACMAADLWIDAEGRLRRHRFRRALMRSAARLTYAQVQAARDGYPDDTTRALMAPVIEPLYAAYRALAAARARRQALEIDLPEMRVLMAEDGTVAKIEKIARVESQKLIEEFMIAANVAAAETLERRRAPCLYRVHEPPDPAKVDALREFLAGLGYRLAKGQVIRPRHFNEILAKVAGTPHVRLVNELVLRTQNQAVYSPHNQGHFGLALRRYAHFTSPIRRYADLVVHRALIGALGLGDGGIDSESAGDLAATGTHLSERERRAVAAERDALDRFASAYLAPRVGAVFAGRISGVTRFGLFVTLDETGTDGLVPIRSLPRDYYAHDEARHRLVGQRHGRTFVLGEPVEVRLAESNAATGSLVLELIDTEASAGAAGRRKRGDKRAVTKPARGRARAKRRR